MKRRAKNHSAKGAAPEVSLEQVAEEANNPLHRANEQIRRWVENEWMMAAISFVLLVAGLAVEFIAEPAGFTGAVRLTWYAVAYVPVGFPVVKRGITLAFRGEIFTEFFLMSIATFGAFYVGRYPESVAVMLFYTVGELFQGAAVNRARRSIKAVLDVRPETASALRNGEYVTVHPADIAVDERIRIRAGERVPLDGEMLSEGSSFNTSALTGESKPSTIDKGETVLAGMINEGRLVELKVTKLFNDSALSRILTLVQNAQGRKAKTELFIRRFARVYTPIVVFLAAGVTALPYFFVDHYVFADWLYRALIFLVISCPCALVVAIPLGYFGGIGAASRNGILFKGSTYLDRMTRVGTVVMDKTGTLTKGVFRVQQAVSIGVKEERTWLPLAAALESQSTHPIAKAVADYASSGEKLPVQYVEEIRGYGLKGVVDGREVLAGNAGLMQKFNIDLPNDVERTAETTVFVAVEGKLSGYVTIADEIREDAGSAIRQMHALNIRTVMLSGDKQAVVDRVAMTLNIDQAFGDLLPERKVEIVEAIKRGKRVALAFAGDGINDAPVLAISDVGIAMGGLGSDAAIETADVVIQTDEPSKIVTAIHIGKATNTIVWQNIALAFGVKIVVLGLGAWGVASMWEAVFADVGVALLAILNAMRIQRMKFQ